MYLLFQLLVCAMSVGTIYCQCSAMGTEVLQRRRLQSLRAGIISQLGLTEAEISAPMNDTAPSTELVEAFDVLVEARESLKQENRRRCQLNSDELYAQPISSFIGTGRQTQSISKRSTESIEPTVLSSYELQFHLNLSDASKDAIKVDLLLYQLPMDDYQYSIMDSTQYVEIKFMNQNLGIQTVIAGRSTDLDSRGYQAFDISSAVKLWPSRGVETEAIVLEVIISCRSSPTCGERDQYGNEPRAIQFDTGDSGSSEKAPRLIITSRNLLDRTGGRDKRQVASSPHFCADLPNSDICCMNKLNISFADDLELDIIVKPLVFEANYCDGLCPLAPVPERNLMAPLIFSFLSTTTPAASVEPCCSGNSYEPLDVIMNLVGVGYKIVQLQNVIVTGCQCG